MGVLRDAGWQPLDNTGAIMSGAKAYWYNTGASTTPKNTYSNYGLSSANANPVVADAYGRFGAIFGLDDAGYRLVLKTSADVTIGTYDEQYAKSLVVDEETRRTSIVTSPRDYGCVGDGSTNDATHFGQALAAAVVLDGEGLTYRVDSSSNVRSGMTLRNMTADFSNASLLYGLGVPGSVGSPVAVSSAVTGGQSITPNSVSGLSAGDLILLYSTDTLATNHAYAELFVIEQISGGDVLVNGIILGTYSTNVNLRKVTDVADVVLEDMTIIAPNGGIPLFLSYARRVKCRNVKIKSSDATEYVRVDNCYGVDIEGCSLRSGDSGEAGGVVIGGASRDITLRGCRIERALAAITVGDNYAQLDGIARDVRIAGCELVWCGGIVVAEGGRYVEIDGCNLMCDASPSVASTPAILVGGADVAVRGNSIRNPEGPAITVTPLLDCDYINITGNRIIGGETHAVVLSDTAFTVRHVEISRNLIRGNAGDYVRCLGTTVTELFVEGNDLAAATVGTKAINLTMADAADLVSASRNKITFGATSFTHGIYYSVGSGTTGRAAFDGNIIDGTSAAATITGIGVVNGSGNLGQIGVCDNRITAIVTGINQAASTADARIDGNTVRARVNVTGTGIAGATGGSISNNTIGRVAGASGVFTGISATGSSGMQVLGNNVIASQSGIVVTGSGGTDDGVTVSGNVVTITPEGGANWYGISLPGSTLRRVSVSGNVVVFSSGGTTCLNIGTVDGISIIGNTFTGGSTGIVFGTVTEAIQSDNVFSGNTATSGTYTNSSVNTGYINLDITTVRLIPANVIQNTTEAGVPDGNTAPLIERINGATDKAHRLVWAAAGVVEIDFAPFAYPPDLDDAQNLTVNLLISKDTNTDSAAVVAVSYFEGIGDSNAGGNTAALATAAITKYTVTIAANDVGAYPTMAKVGLTPGAHNNDAIRLHAAWIEYASKKHTA
jgi:hypothetical protein